MTPTILVADDETSLRESLAQVLSDEGWRVVACADGCSALEHLQTQDIDVLVTDIMMPGLSGLDLLRQAGQVSPQTLVLLITAFGSTESAVQALQLGACDYVVKPLMLDDVIARVRRLLEQRQLILRNQQLRRAIELRNDHESIVGDTPTMRQVKEMIKKVAGTPSNVLIAGESGTGKELVARAIHQQSLVESGSFVPVNCGGIPESLAEAEFFGHRKGAFTGAHEDRIGFFQAADGGTLFLDEVCSLSMSAQACILRAIEDRSVVPVGQSRPISVDVRLVAATNRDLSEAVAEGEFREDLYYRINVVELRLPPLRDRREDIPRLAQHFVHKFNRQMRRRCPGLTASAVRLLMQHEWKGNVRELQNVIERALIFAEDRLIEPRDLPFGLLDEWEDGNGFALRIAMQTYERQHIMTVLEQCDFDKQRAAQLLGIGLSSLYRKIDQLHLSPALNKDN
ncbi:MAG TPA: sigma-54 dependent transcriptional regulator [Phycisphaerae bacterium]|nr:sigma-54 dependent transcriptional regulator [Phycisphaerae bacterium]